MSKVIDTEHPDRIAQIHQEADTMEQLPEDTRRLYESIAANVRQAHADAKKHPRATPSARRRVAGRSTATASPDEHR